ncbi:MAG: nuclear transport factor 2 family protein [Acidobacteriia bacterium]|nr:nuclear transport factor 2 family protein [Terriglobia bacterium]
MKPRVLLFPVVMFLSASLAQAQAIDDHAQDRAYIRQAESDWAESSVKRDVALLERILADDFVGVSHDGKRYSKADEINETPTQPSQYLSNHLIEVEIRFFGDAAVAQGSEEWKKKDGTTGRYVWTDTWIRRGGKWQIVAAEDLVPPTAPNPTH